MQKIRLVPSMTRSFQRTVDGSIRQLRKWMELDELCDGETWAQRVKAIESEEATIRGYADRIEGIDVSALDNLPW